jgi:transcriptional regulatory protein LevR
MPASAFAGRLDLLVGSGQVTPQARELTAQVIDRVEREFSLVLTEDNGALLVTHVALSITRLAAGGMELEAPARLATELAGHPREREAAQAILADVATAIGREMPAAEILYTAAHLCALAESRVA